MKKFFILLSNIMCIIAAYSQSPVIDIFDNTEARNVQGAYYKDTHNNFGPFLGTWKYENNGVIFLIKLKKLSQFHNLNRQIYMDYVVGEYSYAENNIEKINTLGNLNLAVEKPYDHNLSGSIINTAENFPVCHECQPFERRLLLMFSDPSRTEVEGLWGQLVIRKLIGSGPERIEVWLKQEGNISYQEGTAIPYDSFTVPWGKYVLTKVE